MREARRLANAPAADARRTSARFADQHPKANRVAAGRTAGLTAAAGRSRLAAGCRRRAAGRNRRPLLAPPSPPGT
eukprot:432959-Prymnesium_polylepis.1